MLICNLRKRPTRCCVKYTSTCLSWGIFEAIDRCFFLGAAAAAIACFFIASTERQGLSSEGTACSAPVTMSAGTSPVSRKSEEADVVKPRLPPNLQFPERNPSEKFAEMVLESCAFKAVAAAIAGGGLGVALGLFIGGFSAELDRAVEAQSPWREQLRAYGKALAAQIRTYSKNFALWGATYTIAECSVEKYRARHDLWNSLIAGCATGAVLASQPRASMSARTRGQQMSVGCLGVAAFSCAIDYWLEHRHA